VVLLTQDDEEKAGEPEQAAGTETGGRVTGSWTQERRIMKLTWTPKRKTHSDGCDDDPFRNSRKKKKKASQRSKRGSTLEGLWYSYGPKVLARGKRLDHCEKNGRRKGCEKEDKGTGRREPIGGKR